MAFIDDLKKRMALAKQQGWSDDEIQRSALIERAQETRRTQEAQRNTQQQGVDQKKQQQQGAFSSSNPLGFVTSLLPFGEILRRKLNKERNSVKMDLGRGQR